MLSPQVAAPVVYPFRFVAGSAVGSRCRYWRKRPSEHSPTGQVVEAAFDSFERARVFAARWAIRLPDEPVPNADEGCRGTKMRRRRRFWLVPVPIQEV
jgi:hypothetical protein